jgi:putative membrane protein
MAWDGNGPTSEEADEPGVGGLVVRAGAGGVLMGLANLVPGISGGTMLLATGIYPRFIAALGELTTLRFRFRSVLTLGVVTAAAVAAVVLLAEPMKELVVGYRWVMYSLFIGLTLGGAPVLWRLIDRAGLGLWVGAAAGLAAMVTLAAAQQTGGLGEGSQSGFLWMLTAGAAAASAMILPGVSGGYLLLVLGVYVPLLGAIAALREAAGGGYWGEVMRLGVEVVLPVGLGLVLGLGVISNLLRWLLRRFARATLGVLLGLLVGAVAGLFPFQAPVAPEPGDRVKGQRVVKGEAGALRLKSSGQVLEPADYPTAFFQPRGWQVGVSVVLIGIGLAGTWGIDRLGRAPGTGRDSAAGEREQTSGSA